MTVSFVNAGLLTLAQSIGIIMGANIGTTATAWIIAAFGFKFDLAAISVPLIAIGFVFMMSKKKKNKSIGQMVIGFSLLFMGLGMLKGAVPDLNNNPEALEFLQRWTQWGYGSILIFVLIGTILTMVLQASAATMALTLIMVSFGWIPFEIAAAMVLGENIGTTITVNIAAAVGNTQAKRAARSHTIFNIFGVIWVLIVFKPFLKLVSLIITSIGLGDPFTPFAELETIDANMASTTMLYSVAMVHTMFNVLNTLILVWFIPQIERIVTKMVPNKEDIEDKQRLQYIQGSLLETPELSLDLVHQEIIHFCTITKKDFQHVKDAIEFSEESKFDEINNKLIKYEDITDRIEREIAAYLNKVGEGELSAETARRVQSFYRIISELESIGDAAFNIGRIIQRKNDNHTTFDELLRKKLLTMVGTLDAAFDAMIANCKKGSPELRSINNAIIAEEAVNECRNNLRDEHLSNLENKVYSHLTGVYYIDIINEIEKAGDYIINVSESLIEAQLNQQ
jgi:phosphate:Na+ symporter